MLDHLTAAASSSAQGGARVAEVGTSTSTIRLDPGRVHDVIHEFVRMWEQRDYTYQGAHWSLDVPHQSCPSPKRRVTRDLGGVRQPASSEGGDMGIGVLALTFDSPPGCGSGPRPQAGGGRLHQPVGQFTNDNLMMKTLSTARRHVNGPAAGARPRHRLHLDAGAAYHDSFAA